MATAPTTFVPSASNVPIEVAVSDTPTSPPIRAGFVGITTEFWDMFKQVGKNPAQPDTAFEQVLKNLAPKGGFDLRIGGDTTDWTWWPVPGMKRPPWARWTLTPTWMAVAQKLLEDLHAHLIIGINMEADNPLVATTEVNAIKAGIGPTVPTTFELGNEPELYPKWPYYITKAGKAVFGRPQNYSFPEITSEWDKLAAALGHIRLAGVGYSSFRALPHVAQFLHASPDLSLLTLHTYALTPQNCQQGGELKESSLFDLNSLQNLAGDVGEWTALGRQHKVPLRVDEINAVTCGGLRNFSDTMGPALWALNVLPLYAQTGVTGVNFESRPNTAQNLIQPTAPVATTTTTTTTPTTTTPATTTTTSSTAAAAKALDARRSAATTTTSTKTTSTKTTSTKTTSTKTTPTKRPPIFGALPPTSSWQVSVQPEYYGMLAFAQLTPPGSRILNIVTSMPSGLLTWAVQTPQHVIHIVVTNVTGSAQNVSVQAASATGPATAEALASPNGALNTTNGVALGGQTIAPQTGLLSGPRLTTQIAPRNGLYNVTVAPASATILTVNG